MMTSFSMLDHFMLFAMFAGHGILPVRLIVSGSFPASEPAYHRFQL